MPYRLLVRAASRATGRLGWLRGAAGALAGILIAGLAGRLLPGMEPAFPWLVAPMGASAVLVFALPASPLAQPWPVIGGNLVSGAVGLAAHLLVPGSPAIACALAVGGAIAAMSLARCLHPPGGACALLGALGGPAIAAHGWAGLIAPLTVNLAGLVLAGWLWNNLTGHRWPHRLPFAGPAPMPVPLARYETADLDAVLEEWDEVLDVTREDLDALFRALERRVEQRSRQP